MKTSLMDVQLAHNTWATRRVLEACRALDAEAFARELDIGPGSLMRTLAHIIDTMFFFGDCFRGRPYTERAPFEDDVFTPDELLEWLDRADADLHDALDVYIRDHGLDATFAWPFAEVGRVTPAIALAQAFDHGSHHRAQCANMLRRVGVGEVEWEPLLWSREA